MLKEASVSNPFSKGGGGTSYEYAVGAYFLSQLLSKDVPTGSKIGTLSRVEFQPEDAIFPNDLLLYIDDGKEKRVALEIKYDLDFRSADERLRSVLRECWRNFDDNNAGRFNPKTDRFGIVLGTYQRDVDSQLQKLLERARTTLDSTKFHRNITKPISSGKKIQDFYLMLRNILQEFKGSDITDQEIWTFLRCMKIIYLDLKDEGFHKTNCINRLRQFVKEGDSHLANSVYERLYAIVARYDPNGGTIDLEQLKTELGNLIVEPHPSPAAFRNGQMEKYLKSVAALIDEPNNIDGRRLSEYYVENSAVKAPEYEWENDDLPRSEFLHDSWKIENFLQSDDWLILIGASFGIGKTSYSRHLASVIANKALKEQNPNSYTPILVFLKDNLRNVYGQESLSGLLSQIIAPDENSRVGKILLILDGLDEYPGSVDELFKIVEEFHPTYPGMKVVFTSRRKSGVPKDLYVQHFIKLLPFNKNQINEFFKKYGVTLTTDSLDSFGLKDEEKSKPLFCWMLAMIQSQEYSNIRAFKKSWSNNIKKALIYQYFIHSLIRGKHRKDETQSDLAHLYYQEKRILRKIAALKLLHKDVLSLDRLREGLADFGLSANVDDVEPIITSYFSFKTTESFRLVEFIHESFKEYLLAEYYIECIIESKPFRANIGVPSEETISFLGGITEILTSKDVELQNLLLQSDKAFLQSFRHESKGGSVSFEHMGSLRDLLLSRTRDFIEYRPFIFQNRDSKIEERWLVAQIDKSDDDLFWIHRWLSCYILIEFHEPIAGSTIVELLSRAGNAVPPYLKYFRGIQLPGRQDLGSLNLKGANLVKADLSGGVLCGADLSKCDLSGAKLSRSNLRGANILGTNFANSDLSNANLSGVVLQEEDVEGPPDAPLPEPKRANAKKNEMFRHANLKGADLRNVNLSLFNLSELILTQANLAGATLYGTELGNAKMGNCDFSGSRIMHCDMSGKQTDLSFANFRGVVMANTKLSHANLKGATFYGASLTNIDISGADLSGVDLRGCQLRNLIAFGIIVNEETCASGISIPPNELANLEKSLQDIIVRDNPTLKE